MRKRTLILQLQGFSYFRLVVLFIQNVHDEEITLKKSNTTVNLRFSLFWRKEWVHTCYASEKNYDPDICHFLIVLHDKCNLDFEYSKT